MASKRPSAEGGKNPERTQTDILTPSRYQRDASADFRMGRQLRCEGALFSFCTPINPTLTYQQDWARLTSILAPNLMIDYSQVTGSKWDAMTREEFVDMISNPDLLGNSLVATQHFIGASKYEFVTETTATGTHQIRAAHQRYSASDKKEVEAKGHGHGVMLHSYVKMSGAWKIAGVKPVVYWNEYDFSKVFVGC